MLVGTLTNILVKKFLGKKFIPRFAKYLIKFPYYKEGWEGGGGGGGHNYLNFRGEILDVCETICQLHGCFC